MKKLVVIFIIAFLLNWVWENLHSILYLHYQGEAITQLVLLRASFFDAFFITLMAVLLEQWALATNRWAYSDQMPIIPWLEVGLTPAIQLGITAYLAYKMADRFDGGRNIV